MGATIQVAPPMPATVTDPNKPPRTITLDIFGIPNHLTKRDQWVLWRWEWAPDGKGGGKWTKVPIDPRTGKRASTTDPTTWAPFSVALHFLEKRNGEVHGIGYVFAGDFTGIDLDKARDPETGRLSDWAQTIIDRFDSYTEWSITGTGVHIIVEATVPEGGNRKGAVEMYDRARFFVMSGQTIRNGGYIGDRQDELDDFHRETFPDAYAPKPTPHTSTNTEPLSVDLDELRKRCDGNEKFGRLWSSDDSDYGDDTSSADLAFCNIIVRNGGDANQIDDLYRASKRVRDKWDAKRGDSTYGAWTIDRALDGTIVPFSPGPKLTYAGGKSPGDQANGQKPQDADFLPDDVASLKAIIIDLRSRAIAAEQRAERAEARADNLSQLQSKTTGIIRNNKLGQERFTSVALAYAFGNRESAGISEDTASKHVKKLEAEGLIRRRVKWIPETVNRATGEITGGHRALFIGPVTNVTDFVEAVSRLDPEKPKNWGGARPQCANHPNANVIKTTVWTCAECGEELDRDSETLRPNPQDAVFLDDDLAATGTDGPGPGTYTPRGLRPHRYRNDTASHNDGASRAEVEQAYQQLNAIPAAPLDRYTDVSIGRAP